MKFRHALALLVAFVLLGTGVAYAATVQRATCTPDPAITDGATTQSIRVTCSWPKPAPVTVTQTATVTSTQTVTATPPASSTTPAPPTTTATTAPAAYPDASTTGVPAGTTLTNQPGRTITTAGTVIDGANITGMIRISANNVTVRNSKITCGDCYRVVEISDGVTGARLERVEIDGLGKAGTNGADGIYGTATVVGANIHGVENGMQPETGAVLRDSWIHGLDSPGSPHIDGVQIDGARSNILVEHNTVDLRGWTQTAAVMIDNYFGAVDNVTVNNNRLLGGGYPAYSDGRFNASQITGVAYTNNRIGYGQWGYALIANSDPAWSGNVDDQTGNTIPKP